MNDQELTPEIPEALPRAELPEPVEPPLRIIVGPSPDGFTVILGLVSGDDDDGVTVSLDPGTAVRLAGALNQHAKRARRAGTRARARAEKLGMINA